jgi:hypothetical protein
MAKTKKALVMISILVIDITYKHYIIQLLEDILRHCKAKSWLSYTSDR